VTRRANAGKMRRGALRPFAAALGAALLGLLLAASPTSAQGQRGGGHAAAPRYARPNAQRNQGNRAERQQRFQNQNPGYRQQAPTGGYGRGQNHSEQQPYGRQQQNYAQPGQGYGRPMNARPAYQGENVRPAMPANRPYPGASPPGHLGSWLNQHQNVPVQGQEQLLRNDPSFRQLPQGDQQRLMRQLQQVDRMPQQERERRLARAEMIERMSPQERMQLNQSSRQLQALPTDRQQLVKHAFQDLRSVPLDQRQTVLESQRYQGMFSPQERNILGNLLRAEPYEPAR
jgi:Protein of unknown function (DUF3106)